MIPPAVFVWKALVWLAVAAMPFQTLPLASCGCGRGSHALDLRPSAVSEAPAHGGGCCQHQHASSPETCGLEGATNSTLPCNCPGGCLCQRSEEPASLSPEVKESRSAPVSLMVSQAVAGLALAGEPQESSAVKPLGLVGTAPERCATLCRFVL
jgi:hypothetical protein